MGEKGAALAAEQYVVARLQAGLGKAFHVERPERKNDRILKMLSGVRTGLTMGSMIALHNFTPEAVSVPLTIDGANGDTRLVDLLDEEVSMTSANGSVQLDLDAYGYRWLRVLDPGSKRLS